MPRNKTKDADCLSKKIFTRVNERKYKELQSICERTFSTDMSQLLRYILYNRPIKTVPRDITLDYTMEELARLRTEFKRIGLNINQITKLFNSYPEPLQKATYAKLAFDNYLAIETKVDRLAVA